VTLIGMQDCKLSVRHLDVWHSQVRRIPRNSLLLPEVILEDLASNPATMLKPIFKTIWKSLGWEGLFGYAEIEKSSLAFTSRKFVSEQVELLRGSKTKRV
jgi:hypothetical protein